MNRPRRRGPAALVVVLALVMGACGGTPAPTSSPIDGTSVSPVTSPGPTPSASTAAPPAATSASATPIGSGAGCAVAPQSGLLPSDRLADLVVSSTPTDDLVTFVFASSTPGPGGPPRGTLDAASPPFSFAGSGQAIELLGQHAVQVRFSGMTLASEAGEAIYHGPTDAKPNLPALREAIQYDASEGIIGWLVGYDGSGCVRLVRDGNNVTVTIAHREAPAP